MLKKTWIIATAGILALAGCQTNDAERALIGAGGGAAIAAATGNNTTNAALAGAAAGALCDDINLC